jgi:hypothetical protein
MIKNHYFVRFIPGAGGVHLSNLISLDATFNSKVIGLSKDQYIEYLIDYYSMNPINGHLENHHIINDKDAWTNYLGYQDFDLPNAVHIGHAASFDWVFDILETLENKKFISLTFNSNRSIEILQNRIQRFNWPDFFKIDYMREEYQHFYQKEFISTDPVIYNDDINLRIEVEDLFNKNISFVVDSINKKFNLDIPLALAQNLHDHWVN